MKRRLVLGLSALAVLDLLQPGNLWQSGITALANPMDLVTSIVPLGDWKHCPDQRIVVLPSELLQGVINKSNTVLDLTRKFGEPFCKKDNQFFWRIDLLGYKGLFVKIVFDKQKIKSYEFYK